METTIIPLQNGRQARWLTLSIDDVERKMCITYRIEKPTNSGFVIENILMYEVTGAEYTEWETSPVGTAIRGALERGIARETQRLGF